MRLGIHFNSGLFRVRIFFSLVSLLIIGFWRRKISALITTNLNVNLLTSKGGFVEKIRNTINTLKEISSFKVSVMRIGLNNCHLIVGARVTFHPLFFFQVKYGKAKDATHYRSHNMDKCKMLCTGFSFVSRQFSLQKKSGNHKAMFSDELRKSVVHAEIIVVSLRRK